MYLDQQTAEITPEQSGLAKNAEAPSPALRSVSAKVVVNSYLMHRTPEKREEFLEELTEALESDSRTGLFVLAGLRAAGLGYKKIDNQISLSMRHPKLSNPDRGEFSSQLSGTLSDSHGALEILIERGQKELGEPEGRQEMKRWLENMEVAISNSPPMG